MTKYHEKKLVQINDIVKSQEIPKSYLIQLLNKLKNVHLIDFFTMNNFDIHNTNKILLYSIINLYFNYSNNKYYMKNVAFEFTA